MGERLQIGSAEWVRWDADHLARYRFAVEFARGKRVLDAGTGVGYGATILKSMGAADVQAVDISEEAVSSARSSFGKHGVKFIQDDCQTLQRVAGPVDLICSFENIEHLPDPDAFLASAARLLAPDGVLLCSTPERQATPPWQDGKPANPYHLVEWYQGEFLDKLSKFFAQVEMHVQVRSRSYELRERAAMALQRLLVTVHKSPSMFLVRGWRKLLGAQTEWPDVTEIAFPAVEDYPIYPAAVADLFGTPWCNVGICRKPVRAGMTNAE